MAFTAKGFQLYSRDITLKGGRSRKHYFFSRHAPEHANAEDAVPAGYKVGVNRRTGMPYLKKVAGGPRKKVSRSPKKTAKVAQKMPAKKKGRKKAAKRKAPKRKAAKKKSAKKAAKRKAPKRKAAKRKAAKRKAPKRKAAKRKAPKKKAAKRKAPKRKASRKKAARKSKK